MSVRSLIMVIDPYYTTITKAYKVDRITNALKRADIENPLPALTTPAGNQIRDAFFIPPTDDYNDVPGFTQFVNIGTQSKPKWVIDGRPYMSWNRRNDSYRLVASNDYSFQCMRLILTQILATEGSTFFQRLGDIPIKTFIRWITLALAQRFGLALEYQARVSIVAAYYYHTQLLDGNELSEADRHRLAPQIARVTSVPTHIILEVADQLGPLNDADAFATAIRQCSGTVGLSQLKFIDLYTLVANSWIGVNAREHVGVALEHMPTFVAMVYSAAGERSYRKTVLSRRVETTGRPHELSRFADQMFRSIQSRFV